MTPAVPASPAVRTLSRGGANIAYEVRGPADGPAVVLLHNIFCDRRVFDQVAPALPGLRTVAIDFRGHGQSTLGATDYTVVDLVADVIAVLDREGIAQAVVVGLSLGATVALELALAHPARVERLVLMGADGDPDGGLAAFRNGLFCRMVMLLGMRGFVLSTVAKTLFGASYRAETGFPVHRQRLAALDRRAARAAMRAWTSRRSLRQAAAGLRLPTRVVVGDEDVSCPLPCGQRLHAVIPGAELLRIPRAGHTMTAERPAECATAIASFLA
jgi:3-oxoadipate enol-lactonase